MRTLVLPLLALTFLAGCKGESGFEAKADPALEGSWSGQTVGGGPSLPVSIRFAGTSVVQETTVPTVDGPLVITLTGTYRAEAKKLTPEWTEVKSDYDMKSSQDKSIGFRVATELASQRQRMKQDKGYTYVIKDAYALALTDATGRTVNFTKAGATAPVAQPLPYGQPGYVPPDANGTPGTPGATTP